MDVNCGATKELVQEACRSLETKIVLNGEGPKPVDNSSCRIMESLPSDWGGEMEKLDGPPDGFLFVLPYLDLQSRLTMERVSKSFREAVKDNPLIWQHFHVEGPASRKLTDDILLLLTKRAERRLKTLSLVGCLRITELTLQQVLDLNPGLEKLSVPGCTGISVEAIVRLVELHYTKGLAKGMPGIKQVQIRGLYNITKEHLDRLLSVLHSSGGDHQGAPSKSRKPQFYGSGTEGFAENDTRPIDVEVCPSCENIRVVYDCMRHWVVCDPAFPCRGCTFCIPRCEECGICIRDVFYDQCLCSDLVCTECWYSLLKCSECNRAVCGRHAHKFVNSPRTTFTCEECLALAEGPNFSFSGVIE